MPFQPELTVCPPLKLKASVHVVIAAPSLVMEMFVLKPPGQLLVTAYETWHAGLAACALGIVSAATPVPSSAVTAATENTARRRCGRCDGCGDRATGDRIAFLCVEGIRRPSPSKRLAAM